MTDGDAGGHAREVRLGEAMRGNGFRGKPAALALALAAVLLPLLLAGPAAAQSFTVDFGSGGGDGASLSGRVIQGILMITVLSIAPGLLIMVTSFTRIVVVLSLLRSAIGLQQSPPNMVLISLSLFLTVHIMSPVFDAAWRDGLKPMLDEQVSQEQGVERIAEPFRAFMASHVRDRDLVAFSGFSRGGAEEGAAAASPAAPEEAEVSAETVDLRVLIPAFLLSELRRAFEIGFLLFLPFLVIDMVVASILMAMGMMMLPPVMISLPFKIIFFVLTDGWFLIAGSLIRSYS